MAFAKVAVLVAETVAKKDVLKVQRLVEMKAVKTIECLVCAKAELLADCMAVV